MSEIEQFRDQVHGWVTELRERLAGLEAARDADRVHDRDSRHAQNERVARSLDEVRLQVATVGKDFGAQLQHNDACTDAARAEACAAREMAEEVKVEVAAVKVDVTGIKAEVTGIRAAIALLQTTAQHAATRSPAIVGGAVLLDIGHAFGRSKGWW